MGKVREAESEGKGGAGGGSFKRVRSGRKRGKSPQQKMTKMIKPRKKDENNKNAFKKPV